MITLLSVLAIVAILITLSPRFSPRLYKRLVFHPVQYVASDYQNMTVSGIVARDVFIKVSKRVTLHGWFFEYPGAKRAILFSHGNAGNVPSWSQIASHALRNGMSALIYDYRGFGLSTGTPTLKGICRDGLTVFDHMRDSLGIEASQIVLIGISLGSGVACHIASMRDHAGLVLQAGYSSFRKLAREVVSVGKLVPACLFFKPTLDNARTISGLKTPKLIVHGDKDELIDVSHAHRLYTRASDPKRLLILPNSGHSGFATATEAEMVTGAVDEFMQFL